MKQSFASALIAASLSMGVYAAETTPLVKLDSNAPCERCDGYLLPGEHQPSPRTVYRIDSDLPEIYTTNGVLYTTRAVLPAFDTIEGQPVPEEMRTQNNQGFSSIDDDFEVFLYHLSKEHAPGETRRIVVYVKNIGDVPATVTPRQVMEHGPNAGNPTSVESVLTERVLTEKWDEVVKATRIPPGEGGVVGWTKQLNASANGNDTTKATFVTGILRADVVGEGREKPQLEVSVISIPGDADHSTMAKHAAELYDTGARSGEDAMNLLIPPPQCHVRRVVGVSPNVMWVSDPVRFDVATLPDEDVFFQMAGFAVQMVGCENARQSADMLLHPPYVHADTVGNFMMEYNVIMTLTNSSDTPKKVDLEFGKTDAPIGLAWQMIVGGEPATIDELAELPVTVEWAGKKRVENEPYFMKSMLPAGPLTIEPGTDQTISMRLMVVGTSSLPYQIHLKPM